MIKNKLASILQRVQINRGFVWGLLIVGALVAFETFNYSTTDFAMTDLLGDLRFMGLRWATILALAFCGIDFAGIARIFTVDRQSEQPSEVWYLFGAWLLAATMNAILTWWGVSIAIANHASLGSSVIQQDTLLKVVPVFVAVIVWLIRILIIGTFTASGDRLFSQFEVGSPSPQTRTRRGNARPMPAGASSASFRQFQRPVSRPEPSYHPATMKASPSSSQGLHQ